MAERYVLDLEGFADRIVAERTKLLKLMSTASMFNMKYEETITEGRISGMYLAISFLDEYLVKETDRKE